MQKHTVCFISVFNSMLTSFVSDRLKAFISKYSNYIYVHITYNKVMKKDIFM